MKYERWIGSHNWETSNQSIDGYPSFNDRCKTDIQDLDDLVCWLEYANTGYPAARQSAAQEERWGKLVRNILCERLIQELVFFADNTFQCKCVHCYNKMRGTIHIPEKDYIKNTTVTIDTVCDCLKGRESDLLQYIEDKIGDWL